MTAWPDLPTHRAWLQEHLEHLLAFGRRIALPGGGAAWLHDDGTPWPARGLHTWITCRTVHAYGLGALLGVPGCRPVAQGALAGLLGPLHDDEHGGWFSSLDAAGVPAAEKSAYAHAFVVLAGTTATVAGLEGGRALLDKALATHDRWFWDEAAGRAVDTWDVAFSSLDDYRGINANMHTVEAYLAAADVTGDRLWLDRAARIAAFAASSAAAHGWRLPEHFGPDWAPDLELNADRPDDPFKPYGATVGHGLEWARLMLHLEAAGAPWPGGSSSSGAGSPGSSSGAGSPGSSSVATDAGGWLPAARALFGRAVADGWAADGADGFVYTTDWSGRPVVRARMHWVAAEAIGAAAALHARTGDDEYAAWYARVWDYVDRCVIDHEHGSWHHELAPDNTPSAAVWPGKADLYHAVQATLIPRLPLAPSLATAVSRGLLTR
jgi:mannose/cellobiose epimerase-like protein (N-acyl-D-glucosamine 2-epimerase family)